MCCWICLQDIGAQIGKSATSYKSKFSTVSQESHTAAFKLAHVNKAAPKELPKDLHDKLEAIGGWPRVALRSCAFPKSAPFPYWRITDAPDDDLLLC